MVGVPIQVRMHKLMNKQTLHTDVMAVLAKVNDA